MRGVELNIGKRLTCIITIGLFCLWVYFFHKNESFHDKINPNCETFFNMSYHGIVDTTFIDVENHYYHKVITKKKKVIILPELIYNEVDNQDSLLKREGSFKVLIKKRVGNEIIMDYSKIFPDCDTL